MEKPKDRRSDKENLRTNATRSQMHKVGGRFIVGRGQNFKIGKSVRQQASEPTATTAAAAAYNNRPSLSSFREDGAKRIIVPVKKLNRSRTFLGDVGAIPEIGIPGIRNILNRKYCFAGKLLWGVAILTCTGICLYQLVDRFTFYLEHFITAGILVNTNHSLHFPLVSLCPAIPFRSSDAIIKFKEELSTKINRSVKTMEDIWQEMPLHDNISLEKLWNMTIIDRDRIYILPSCGYGRREEECPFNFELKHTFSTLTGFCWVIGKINDTDPIEYQGPLTGLVIRIDESPSRYDIETIMSFSRANREDRALGYSIFFHDEETSPKYDASYRGIAIYHSVVTIMAFSIQQFIFLNTTEKPCTTGQGASSCWTKCIEDRIIEQVPCRLPFLDYDKLPICNGTQDYNLSYLAPRNIYLNTSVQDCECPRRCETTAYIHNTYVFRDLQFPNTTAIKIYFQDNAYQTVKQSEAYPWIALMSDVGGTMGLFLGMCLLSFGELLEIGVKLIHKFVYQNWKHNP